MAFVDWIKVEHTTPDKPEILKLAELLNIDPDLAFAKLIRLWIWADQNSTNGHLNVTQMSSIDRTVRCTGFGDALAQVGWLHSENGILTIPNFDVHNSESSKKRANNSKNKRTRRQAEDKCPQNVLDLSPEEGTVSSSSSSSSSISYSSEGGTGETSSLDNVFQDLPKELDTPEFRFHWPKWESYKKKKGRAIQPYQRSPAWHKTLEEFKGHSVPDAVITAMTKAMAEGWSSYYPPKVEPKKPHDQPHNPKTAEQVKAEQDAFLASNGGAVDPEYQKKTIAELRKKLQPV